MKLRISARDPATLAVDALVLPFVPPRGRARLRAQDLPLPELLPEAAASWVVGETDAVTWVQTRHGRAKTARVMLASLGPRTKADDLPGGACGSVSEAGLRVDARHAQLSLGARIERAAAAAHLRKLAIFVDAQVELGAALVEGLRMRAYAYGPEGELEAPYLREVHLVVAPSALAEAKTRVQRAWDAAEAACIAREIADLPPNLGTPEGVVQRARELSGDSGLRVSVMGPKRIAKEGMGLVEAVSRGAQHPAQILCMEHNAERADALPTVVWIGKGVTIDAGGYDLKRHGIADMNYDKAGAAAVIGAVLAAARAQVDVHIVALCPLAENLIGREALLSGEVVRAFDGTEVFVENTDAEGRLLLADVLSWSSRFEADLTIDLATLTGASHVALGEAYGALFSNDNRAREIVHSCGERSDDRVWPMPIHDYHDRELAHPRADLKNVGVAVGAASAGAAFLRYFVSGPWAHVDMAGKGHFGYERDYTGAGASGYGARLLLALAHELGERGGLDLPTPADEQGEAKTKRGRR